MLKNANLFKDFSPEQIIFATALADPTDDRTQSTIAASLGVHPTTLCRWKKESGFSELVWRLTYQNLEAEIGRVSAVVLRNALGGDIRTLRLFYELLGKIGGRTAVPCTRNHALDTKEIVDGMASTLTERQFGEWIQGIDRILIAKGIPPECLQKYDCTQIDFAFDDVQVTEVVDLQTV